MPGPDQEVSGQVGIDEEPDEPTRDLDAWRQWREDQALGGSIPQPGIKGRLAGALKRAVNPVLRRLWKRQIGFNLSVIDHLEAAEQSRYDLLRDLREIRRDLLRDVQNNHRRIAHLEAFKREGYADVMRHSDALYAVVDQKLDRYRRQSQELWSELGGLLALARDSASDVPLKDLDRTRLEQDRHSLESSIAFAEDDTADVVASLEPSLPSQGRILSLGCGAPDTLEALTQKGYDLQAVDSRVRLVEACRQRGVDAIHAEIPDLLAHCEAGSLAGIVAHRVIERLEPEQIDRLVRLAWRALEPGGVLIVVTPNPLSLVASARDFWRHPEHRRPVHPDTLAFIVRQAGFENVQRLDLRPFDSEECLSALDLEELPPEQRALGERLNRIRDELDDLLFGSREFAVVGSRPSDPAGATQSSAQIS